MVIVENETWLQERRTESHIPIMRLVRLSRRTRLFLWLSFACILLCGAFTAIFLVAGVRRFNIGKTIDDAANGRDGVSLAFPVIISSNMLPVWFHCEVSL